MFTNLLDPLVEEVVVRTEVKPPVTTDSKHGPFPSGNTEIISCETTKHTV